jgi:O-antigen ligase
MYITFKKHPETIELAFKTIIIPILISCVISLFSPERAQLLESLSRGEIIVHSYARGLYDTVSGLSWGMGHVTAITCYYSFKSKLNYQKAIWLGIFIMFLYVNSTLTIRGGFIAAIGSSFIVIYLLLIKNSSVLGRLVLILFIIFTFVFAGNKLVSYFFFQSKGKEVQEITLSYDDMNELSTTRWGRYNYAIREIKQHPLTGIGFHQGLEEATYGTADFHNGILNNAVSAGLISTFVLIVFLLLIFRVIQSRIKDYLIHKQSDIIVIPIAIMFSNLINFLIESGSAFTSTYIGILFWVSLSVLCCGHTNVLRLPVKVLSLGRKTPIPTGEHR